MNIVVLVVARDRPGLLQEITTVISRLGANIITNFGYTVDGKAYILFLAEIMRDFELFKEAVEEEKIEEAEVEIAKLGPDGAELIAVFLENRLEFMKILEAYLEPPDILDILVRLSEDRRKTIYRMLSTETIAGLLDQGDETIIKEISTILDPKTLAQALEKLDPDEAVDILQVVEENRARSIILNLPREYREQTKQLLRYPPDSAGGIMTRSVPILAENTTVQEALQKIREGDYDVRDTIVVVDRENRLVGLVGLDELLRYPLDEYIGRIAVKPRVTVTPDVDREDVAKTMLRYYVNKVPVVDEENRFLGIITVEDITYVISEEAAEDIAKVGGAVGGFGKYIERYLSTSVKDLVGVRLTWLIVIYIVQAFTANILKSYEDVISRAAIIAAFIPLVMDTGGNVGSQASSMIIRALALGEISDRSRIDLFKVILKEVATSTIIGFVFSIIGLGFAYIVSRELMVAVAVAVTLFLVIVMADLVGSLLPIISRRIGFDPAALSAPLITTLVDVSVALIYMSVASKLVLGI